MSCTELHRLIAEHTTLAPLRRRSDDCGAMFAAAIELAEQALWADGFQPGRLALYQQLYRTHEAWIASLNDDPRHHISLIIPVADRPHHLQACLASLLELCRAYAWGGVRDGRYRRVEVLIADDSADAASRERHAAIAAAFDAEGLPVHYLGHPEQRAELERLGAEQRARLAPILGELDLARLGHKGASSMRNLAYLWLARHRRDGRPRLFFFLDSDQEFRVRVDTPAGECEPYAVNYLHHLDRLFAGGEVRVLTGKVVGDPPVSPAVMAGNLLLDLHAFLAELAAQAPDTACTFHRPRRAADDASYHDMANLFGFTGAEEYFHYPCRLSGAHDHSACLDDFAALLGRFFDGEHPTRKTGYHHQPVAASVQPARTIYTGNYCLAADALDWFIPFAALRLRMAGPVLGRLIKAELGPAFVSANLPMLHRRTLEALGQSEFRPGVERGAERVELGGEFERQFFGDLMLFSMERLTAEGYPARLPDGAYIAATLDQVEADLQQRYAAKRTQVSERLDAVEALFNDPAQWWWQASRAAGARAAIAAFLADMRHNFGPAAHGYAQITDPAHARARKAAMCEALLAYPALRQTWQITLEGARP